MEYLYERKVNYYETDKMGVVHHSNYIRYMEEARIEWMDKIGLPMSKMEKAGVTIPVLGISCDYKYHVTFEDIILVKLYIKEYNGVRMTVEYEIKNKKTGNTVLTGETRHCFTSNALKPVNLKKFNKEFNDIFENLLKN